MKQDAEGVQIVKFLIKINDILKMVEYAVLGIDMHKHMQCIKHYGGI